jgi:hypothetical protein
MERDRSLAAEIEALADDVLGGGLLAAVEQQLDAPLR